MPFLRLRQVFGFSGGSLPPRENVVVLRHEDALTGIAVDKLLGECQAIIKPLSRLFRDVRGSEPADFLHVRARRQQTTWLHRVAACRAINVA